MPQALYIGTGTIGDAWVGSGNEAIARLQAEGQSESFSPRVVPSSSGALVHESDRKLYGLLPEPPARSATVTAIVEAPDLAEILLYSGDPNGIVTVVDDSAPTEDVLDTFLLTGDCALRAGVFLALRYVATLRRWLEIARIDPWAAPLVDDEVRYARFDHAHSSLASLPSIAAKRILARIDAGVGPVQATRFATSSSIDWTWGTDTGDPWVQPFVRENSILNSYHLADMPAATVKGRQAGAGTGDPDDLTADELVAILDTASTPYIPSIGSSTDNAVVRFDGTGGDTIQNGVVTISDTGVVDKVSTYATDSTSVGSDAVSSKLYIRFRKSTPAGPGFGAALEINLDNDANVLTSAGAYVVDWTDATNGAEYVRTRLRHVENGSYVTPFAAAAGVVSLYGVEALTTTGTQTVTNKTIDGDDNTFQDIPYTALAAGTDGELITWDASGNPATVGVGTSGQILTSNGPGAAPTFQDAAAVYTDENAQDAVGGILANGEGVNLTYSDVTPSITADLNFAGLAAAAIAASDVLSFYDGAAHKKIAFSAFEALIDHNALTNYDLNQHYDHSAITLTAGAALSGGGDITTNRTFDVNVDDSTIEIATDALQLKDGGTTLAKLADISATRFLGRQQGGGTGAVEELTPDNAVAILLQATNKTGAASLVFNVSPTLATPVLTNPTLSGGNVSVNSSPTVFKFGSTELLEIADNASNVDYLQLTNGSGEAIIGIGASSGSGAVDITLVPKGSGVGKINSDTILTDASTIAGTQIDIAGLTADGSPNGAADYVMTYDDDAGTNKKVLLNNLPGGGGSSTFVGLSDTPGSITASQFVAGNSGGTDLEFGKAVPTGDVVGTTDTQTLSGKTITTPTIDGSDAGTNSVLTLATIVRNTSSTAAAGLGERLQFQMEHDGGGLANSGALELQWTDASSGSTTSDMLLYVHGPSGSEVEALQLIGETSAGELFGNAILTDASSIAYAQLADGTAGELLTWDASGNIATIAVGTLGQVLTSNGPGAAPTFEDATGGGGAPTDATYITQTANGTLTNEQALSSLATGILKNTTATGVLSIASGSDLPSHASEHESGGGDALTHNNLAGLTSGDPHTQYLLANGSRELTDDWYYGTRTLSGKNLECGVDDGGNAIPASALHVANEASSNTKRDIVNYDLATSGAAGANLGQRFNYKIENSSGALHLAAQLGIAWTDATDTSEDSDWALSLYDDGAQVEALHLIGSTNKGELFSNEILVNIDSYSTNTSPNLASDSVLTYDNSASTHKKITLGALMELSIVPLHSWSPAQTISAVTDPCSILGSGTNKYLYLEAGTEKYFVVECRLPPHYSGGDLDLVLTYQTDGSDTDNVGISYQTLALGDGDDIESSFPAVTNTTFAVGTGSVRQTATITVGTGASAGDTFRCRVGGDSAGWALTDNVKIYSIDLVEG